jgi:hypothetical protein
MAFAELNLANHEVTKMADPDFDDRVKEVEAEGKDRYGDNWPRLIGALGRRNPGGISPDAMRQTLAQPHAVELLAAAGRDSLLDAASNGDRDAEKTYAAIREEEREAHRLYKKRR